MEKKDETIDTTNADPERAIKKLDERIPAEGADSDEESQSQSGAAAISGWHPNDEFLNALVEMGISRNAAVKGLYYTGNTSAEAATEWVFDNAELADLHEPFQIDHSLTGFAAIKDNMQSPYKMVFIVNASLKMGVGKIGAQIGHAAVGLYRELIENRGEAVHLLAQWQENGETKIVVKGENTQALMDLESLAMEHRIATYLVTDAGRTQVTSGAVTVLGLIGAATELDAITGKLKLL